jgi:hypothetical protein
MASGQQEAIFRVPNSHGQSSLAAFGTGFSGAFGVPALEGAGIVANFSSRPSNLPHSVLLGADDQGISLFATHPDGQKAQLLLQASRGQFHAALHRNVGRIELILSFPEAGTIDLRGKWGPITRQPMRVARAVLAVSRKE